MSSQAHRLLGVGGGEPVSWLTGAPGVPGPRTLPGLREQARQDGIAASAGVGSLQGEQVSSFP